nr:DoxX family protein [uncultured Flavobacterium sp.]
MKFSIIKIITKEANKDLGLLVLRVLAVFSILKAHGLPKLLNFQDSLIHIPDPLGLGATFSIYYAIFTNIFCAILVALGLGTRFAAFFIITLTLSGLFIVHINDSAKVQDTPLIYSILFGFITYMGAGKYSLDYKFFKN